MRSRLFVGRISHQRLAPRKHGFTYPFFCFALDLAELPELSRRAWFGYNRRALFALHDDDYLAPGRGSIEGRLRAFLASHGIGGVARIELVTSPRFLGYAFNPVSFFYCYDVDDTVLCIVAEVNNTFGERHLYLLADDAAPLPGFVKHYVADKSFYVSPFNEVDGEYDFRFADLHRDLRVEIRLLREGRVAFTSALRGRPVPLDPWRVAATVLRHPLNNFLTMPRIHWEAARLFFTRHLPLTVKPRPDHPNTVRAVPPTVLHSLAVRVILGFFSRIERGRLTIVMPDGAAHAFGTPEPGLDATVWVGTYDFFLRLVKDGDVALGEGYTADEYRCSDLTTMLRIFIANREALDDKRLWSAWLGRAWNRLRHVARRNTRAGSSANIRAHYDLGDALFTRFLDSTMSYSCAVFEHPEQALEDAQMNKVRGLIRKARLGPQHHLLEIGCGWGTLAIEAARTTGCRVTGVTLSEDQLRYARQKVREAGLEDRIDLRLCDYRDLQGRYDRIISVEMLEAVGHENLGTFFRQCDKLLAPDGFLVLQVITVPDEHYDVYRRGCDWIQKVIFPGGLCPAVSAITAGMAKSRLVLEHLENIGVHYAETLRRWRRAFEANWPDIERHGYDARFKSTWDYYFAYCEAGFATRTVSTVQTVMTRPGNRTLGPFEGVR